MELFTLLVMIVVIEEMVLFLWMRFVLKGLKFERTIEKDTAYVGDKIAVKVESYNYKILPIPWIRYIEDMPHHMLIHGSKLNVTKTKLNNDLITVTSLFSFQKITRKYYVEPTQRGDYFFKDVDLEIGDFFGAHKRKTKIEAHHRLVVYPKVYPLGDLIRLEDHPQGEVSVKRWIMPDPIDVVGSRNYTGNEPFNMIDWKATAKTNGLQVKQYDFHADPAVMILLSLQTNEVEWFERDNALAEKLIQITASVIEEATAKDVSVGLGMTATLSNGCILEPMFPKRHQHQKIYLLDTLAKATYYNTKTLNVLINQVARKLSVHQTLVVIAAVLDDICILQLNQQVKNGFKVILMTMDTLILNGLDKRIEVYHVTEQVINDIQEREVTS